MTPPVVLVQLAKALQPPLCDAHASVSTPTDVMYPNNSSDEDDGGNVGDADGNGGGGGDGGGGGGTWW